jgi:hypothetical protein
MEACARLEVRKPPNTQSEGTVGRSWGELALAIDLLFASPPLATQHFRERQPRIGPVPHQRLDQLVWPGRR